ncbi:hypothetical protein DL96DRAFT_1587820 [Flagelloscypha sp. PMI_526]|nr:hypothetical protein DL96DRAFT_1587820 [Flagelloscypha sp. PMI_526]
MPLSYSKACLIGSLFESIAYGLYFSLFVQSVVVLQRKYADGQLSRCLTFTHVILFVLITMHLILDNEAVVEAFTEESEEFSTPDQYYTITNRETVFRHSVYIILTLVSDSFMLYRVFVVWSRQLIPIFAPALLILASLVVGILYLIELAKLFAISGSIPPPTTAWDQQKVVFYALTLGLNVICTVLIALRVWSKQKRTIDRLQASFMHVRTSLVVIVESAALYTSTLVAIIMLTALRRMEQYVLLNALPGIIGISFSLITIRMTPSTKPPLHQLQAGDYKADSESPTTHITIDTVIIDGMEYTTDDSSGSHCR